MTMATHPGMRGPSKAERHPHVINSDQKKEKKESQNVSDCNVFFKNEQSLTK